MIYYFLMHLPGFPSALFLLENMRKLIPLVIALWGVVLPGVYAQDCDCDDSDNCPFAITPNFAGEVCFEITDALNNDLANPDQGICGVQLTFTHQHIWDLELSLVSPAGDTVPLTGFNTNFFGTTNNVLWNILFIPCANTPSPDTINGNALEEVWTNNQSWPFAANFSGSYLPVGGNCLESFDNGPVNGSWCLLIDNQPSTYFGNILNFEVLLCDNSGLLCCDADGGTLPGANPFVACEGDSSLWLSLPAQYGPIEPDEDEYGYVYVISDENGVILSIDSIPNLIGYDEGSYEVCGLSYLLSDSSLIPDPDMILTVSDLTDDLNSGLPSFCGNLSDNCIDVQVVPPPPPTMIEETICDGDTLFLAGDFFTEAGAFEIVLETDVNCDSVILLDLFVQQIDTVTIDQVICQGEVVAVGDSLYSVSGTYQNTLTASTGCDSLVFLDLTVLQPDSTFLADTICAGEIYMLGDSTFQASGSYLVEFINQEGCDSMVFLNLTELDLQATIVPTDTITCDFTNVLLNGTASSNQSGVLFEWTTPDGTIQGATDGMTAIATQGGTYIFTVSQEDCLDMDTTQVVALLDAPLAIAGLPDTLNCLVDSLQLNAVGSDTGPDIQYQWFTTSGQILSGGMGLFPWVGSSGTYDLVVSNVFTGCSDTSSVVIVGDFETPLVEAGPDQFLNCITNSVVLDGSATFSDGPFQFEWTDNLGNPVAWVDSLQAAVSTPGWYYLTAVNLNNGCSGTDSVEVIENAFIPIAEAGPTDTLNCFSSALQLDGSGSSSGADILYQWTTPDGLISGASDVVDPIVNSPGQYILTVTDTLSMCSAVDTVAIGIDTLSPEAEAGTSLDITCSITSVEIGDENATSQGIEFLYFWTNTAGDTISESIVVQVSEGDTYTLTVFNQENGCSASDAIEVDENTSSPLADAGPPGILTCDEPVYTLDGSNSSNNIFFSYAWYNNAGQLVGENLLQPVNQPGDYCLVVTNEINFCKDTSCTTVTIDAGLPLVFAGLDTLLDCTEGEVILDGSASSGGPEYEYEWSTSDGQIISDIDQAQITVDAPGIYVLTITNNDNDCVNTDSVAVVIDTLLCTPLVNAGADGVINCFNLPSVTLNAVPGTSAGPNIEYLWTAVDGVILTGETTLTPEVSSGTFILTAINTTFGLTAMDTVFVGENLQPPIADAGPDQILDCLTLGNNFQLDGTGSSQGTAFLYEWTSLGGPILSGVNTLTPEINEPGIYELTVTDTINGCSATNALLIALDGDLPEPCIPEIYQIPCGDLTAMIGDTCTQNTYTYQWTTDDGLIIGSDDLALIEAGLNGSVDTFSVLVTDTSNACFVRDTVLVFEPVSCFPVCEIAPVASLSCDVDSVVLDASGSSQGVVFVYEWNTTDGLLCGPADSLLSCAAAPGIYELTIIDTTTNFSCTQQVEVVADLVPPLAEAGDSLFLNCGQDTVVLNGSGSSSGPAIAYNWIPPTITCLLSAPDEINPVAGCEGWYLLEVTDQQNGCSATDSVWVGRDTLAPAAILQTPDSLNCAVGIVSLNGSLSSAGPDYTYAWYQGGAVFDQGTDLTIVEVNQAGDYCLEVIDITNACRDTACVTVFQDVSLPQVDAGPDLSLTCAVDTVQISGTAPAGNFSYLWTSVGGCILTDPTQLIILTDCPGTYQLTVTDLTTACTGTATMQVEDLTDSPFVDGGPNQLLSCGQPQIVLDGSNSEQGPDIVHQWETDDGNIISGANTLTPQIDQAGTYWLIATNELSGCVDTSFVIVLLDEGFPAAAAGPDQLLSCDLSTVFLDGTASAQGDSITYEWTAVLGGDIISGDDTTTPVVNGPGVYELIVTNLNNQCQNTDQVTVGLDTVPPVAAIASPDGTLITCDESTLSLNAENSLPQGLLSFFWETTDGNIVSGVNNPVAEVDASGVYTLIVVNTENGCQDTTQLDIQENTEPPLLVIETPPELSCQDTMVMLDATSSSGAGTLIAEWTVPPGSQAVILNPNTLTPTVFSPETYFLSLTDESNGCTATGEVTVVKNAIPPLAVASALEDLDCVDTLATITAAGSSEGVYIAYDWTSLDGGAIFPTLGQEAEVNAPGDYQLIVINTNTGCSDTTEVTVVENTSPIVGVAMNLGMPTCFGDQDAFILIDSVIGGTPEYFYSLNGGDLLPYEQYNYLEAGVYQLAIEDINGCIFDTIFLIDTPEEVVVDLGPDISIQLGESVEIEALTNLFPDQIDTLIWKPLADPECPACFSFEIQPTFPVSYTVEITDINGCKATDQVNITLNKEDQVYIANAFSPNGDGDNDVFFIQAGQAVVEIEYLQILDRWGNLVFSQDRFQPNDPNFGWNGNFRGMPMNPAVFVWVAKVNYLDGTSELRKGDLILIR
jgi:gliding motility-associated-like protein